MRFGSVVLDTFERMVDDRVVDGVAGMTLTDGTLDCPVGCSDGDSFWLA